MMIMRDGMKRILHLLLERPTPIAGANARALIPGETQAGSQEHCSRMMDLTAVHSTLSIPRVARSNKRNGTEGAASPEATDVCDNSYSIVSSERNALDWSQVKSHRSKRNCVVHTEIRGPRERAMEREMSSWVPRWMIYASLAW